MRAIFIYIILSIFLMTGCASVEVARGVTKAKQSLETSIKKILKPTDENQKEQEILVEEQKISKEDKEQEILVEEQKISKEQKIVIDVVKKQKESSTISVLGKTMVELDQLLGQPLLIREDGKTISARFDSKSCRLFVFMNATTETPQVEYFELRNSEGKLIDVQKDIELCFKEIKPV